MKCHKDSSPLYRKMRNDGMDDKTDKKGTVVCPPLQYGMEDKMDKKET